MTACVICGRPCTPMADYDQPVCLHCDDTMDLILARASTVDVVLARPLQPHGTHAAYNRHKDQGTAPCGACVHGERLYQAARYARRRGGRALAVAS